MPLHTQALTELDNIKRQIKQPFMAKSTVEASIARLEDGLKARTQVRKQAVARSQRQCSTPTQHGDGIADGCPDYQA